MSENRLHHALRAICQDLESEKVSFALVGGLAVSARTEPRFTKDLDLAVAVADDREAEAVVRSLRGRSYQLNALIEQESLGRLAAVRLLPPSDNPFFVDLLFASSGIEREIVEAATPLEIIAGCTVPVATLPHLAATKVLSRDDSLRPQDRADLIALLKEASEEDLHAVREALEAIRTRGFHRGRDLLGDLEQFLGSVR
jgi:predicted nucleotidyltransferase